MTAGSGSKAFDVVADVSRDLLCERLAVLEQEIGRADLGEILAVVADSERSGDLVRDQVSTRLMEIFRGQQSRAAFGLLYELNHHHILQQIHARLRRFQARIDPHDVLQEVFFNVYRYPHRFDCTRDDAFRVWTATIVRNTVLKCLRSMKRGGRCEVPFEDLTEQPEVRTQGPLGGVVETESAAECRRVYLTYLQLYLSFYSMLSDRERRAIHMVEVDNRSYRDAARDLGIKLENLKMVIFRARRKIHRSMRRVFEGLPPDFRPARDPLISTKRIRSTAETGSVDEEGSLTGLEPGGVES